MPSQMMMEHVTTNMDITQIITIITMIATQRFLTTIIMTMAEPVAGSTAGEVTTTDREAVRCRFVYNRFDDTGGRHLHPSAENRTNRMRLVMIGKC
jgi:hypothetical protein